jgi:hypothetical protein
MMRKWTDLFHHYSNWFIVIGHPIQNVRHRFLAVPIGRDSSHRAQSTQWPNRQ